MRVAYIYHTTPLHSYAGETVAQGFKNAFLTRNDDFKFFDIEKLKKNSGFLEKFKLLQFGPDIIFTSLENIHFLPLNLLKSTKIVLWGQFYSPCDFEPQIHSITKETKSRLQKYSAKHDLLVWSQHDEKINERFFSGYQEELGLKFIQLLHAADPKYYAPPLDDTEFDFVWIGNVGHRINRYNKLIVPLKEQLKNYLEFTEKNSTDPGTIESKQWYRRSFMAPNIHTDAQVDKGILINERVFSATMAGGFQLVDNPLARKYFPEDELIIVETASEILDHFHHFRLHPEERIKQIKKMQENILQNHTYPKRVETILSQF